MTLIQAEESLIDTLYKHIQEGHIAKRMMSAPVLSVEQEKTIRDTKDLLDGYTVNTLLVVDESQKPLIYYAADCAASDFSRLETECVQEYMLTDVKTVAPDTQFSDIELLMIQRPQKILPVVNEKGQAIGVITKNDILKVLQEYTLEKLAYHSDTERAHTRNVRRLMEERLPEHVITLLRDIGDLADELGYSVYVVGGFVRDLILRAEENLDVDIVIEGDGIRFAKALSKRWGARVRIHRKFCTAVVIFLMDLSLMWPQQEPSTMSTRPPCRLLRSARFVLICCAAIYRERPGNPVESPRFWQSL